MFWGGRDFFGDSAANQVLIKGPFLNAICVSHSNSNWCNSSACERKVFLSPLLLPLHLMENDNAIF